MTAGRERGSVSVLVAVLGLAILMSLALVVDGGRRLAALSDASGIAEAAARVGAQEVDLDRFRDTGRPVVDQARAEAAIADHLARPELAWRIERWAVLPATGPDADIEVVVEVSIRPRAFFFPARSAVAVETATATEGIDGP